MRRGGRLKRTTRTHTCFFQSWKSTWYVGWKGETSDKIRRKLMKWGFLLRWIERHVSLRRRSRMHMPVSDCCGSKPKKYFVEKHVEPVSCKKSIAKRSMWSSSARSGWRKKYYDWYPCLFSKYVLRHAVEKEEATMCYGCLLSAFSKRSTRMWMGFRCQHMTLIVNVLGQSVQLWMHRRGVSKELK